ncbi:MAG TPA: hypothetical protein VGB91_05095 [Rhizomicrobium sp.]
MPTYRDGLKLLARACAIGLLSALGACGTFYVDSNLHDLAPSERVGVANPKPVQLLFDFQTKGASNSRARDELVAPVTKAVQDSALFSDVGPAPAAGGALLQVTVNNVPLTDDAFARGFAVGFTFGLVGTTVGDGYVCTVDYVGAPDAAKITKVERDAIYTSLGATASTPEHATKAKSLDEAVHLMLHKCVGNALNDLARDPAFSK